MSARTPFNIQPKRILVITLRYLGDTLLVTPLISSLKAAYPDAAIDVLLSAANMGIFEGNPEVSQLVPMPDKSDKIGYLRLLWRLFRRYDLAIATQAGDRPVLCAVIAGKMRLGFVPENAGRHSWKRRLLDRYLEFGDHHTHAVLENLRFCELLQITPSYALTPPTAVAEWPLSATEKYAVLHLMPQWRYKQWGAADWIQVGRFIHNQGYTLILTGSSQADELAAIAKIQQELPGSTLNLAGRLSLAQLTGIIKKSALFVGPDTGITHLAAAVGVPVFALFGPTDPKKWGPWPFGYEKNQSPFAATGTQKINNVCLIQGVSSNGCVPCQLEGCNRNRQSHSLCLEQLPAEIVIKYLQLAI